MSTKAKTIEVIEVHRTRRAIACQWRQGDGTFNLDEPDNPLPAFTRAFDALAPIIAAVLHVPMEWTESNLRVVGVKMGKQGGADQVSFVFRKGLDDASKEFVAPTPPRLLAHPTEPGSYTPPLCDAHVALVAEMLEQAKAYIKGDRAQGTINLDGEDDDDEGGGSAGSGGGSGEDDKNQPQLGLGDGEQGGGEPKRGSGKKRPPAKGRRKNS